MGFVEPARANTYRMTSSPGGTTSVFGACGEPAPQRIFYADAQRKRELQLIVPRAVVEREIEMGVADAGEAVRVEAGQENAGVVDIGDGLSIVFKVESHNHPSAVEPYTRPFSPITGPPRPQTPPVVVFESSSCRITGRCGSRILIE